MFSKGIVAIASCVLLSGCGTVKGDMEVMCNMSTVCPPPEGDPSHAAFEQAKCLEGKIKTEQGRKAFESLAGVSPQERPSVMRNLAESAGVTSCPQADALERSLPAK